MAESYNLDVLEKLNIIYKSDEWYSLRLQGIGGSDAGAIMGLSTWQTPYGLWQEKTGRAKLSADKHTTNSAIEYGLNAEEYLTALFALDYPKYRVIDTKDFVYKRGFMIASLDAELLELDTGRRGFLEIKTTEIRSALDEKKWQGKIPYNYYAQILHYFNTTQFDFAVLKVQIKSYDKGGQALLTTKHYYFERTDCIEDLKMLAREEFKFWRSVQTNTPPSIHIN